MRRLAGGLLLYILTYVLVMLVCPVYPIWEQAPLTGKTIVIDPGHGGIDSGAFYDGINEKDINLTIARHLQRLLSALGARVILTRSQDTDPGEELPPDSDTRQRRSLKARVLFSQQFAPDLMISIHANAFWDPGVRGLVVFFKPDCAESEKAAGEIFRELKKVYQNVQGYRPGDYYILRENRSAAVLIEVGYLSNEQERTLLTSENFLQTAANLITRGVCRYFRVGDNDV